VKDERLRNYVISGGSATTYLVYKPYFFSQRTIFFSHNKSANSIFSHGLSAKGAQINRAKVSGYGQAAIVASRQRLSGMNELQPVMIFKVDWVEIITPLAFSFRKKTQVALGLATKGPIKRETKQ